MSDHYQTLEAIQQRPKPFEFYTADTLWTDPHIARKMLETHLNPETDLASRKPEFVKQSLDFLCKRFSIGQGTRILDLGCGPGLYTAPLAETGADVTGVDFSASSLDYARSIAAERGLSIRYRQRNYLDMEPEPGQDVILLIYCDFCPLSPDQRAKLLGLVRQSLAPNGCFFFDVVTLSAFQDLYEEQHIEVLGPDNFWSASPCHLFTNTFLYPEQHLHLSKYTLVEPKRTRTVFNWLQYFSLEALRTELRQNGFTLEEVYSDVRGMPYVDSSPEIALVARKA